MFKERLKELRIERDLTQKQLADILHMQNTAISKYELGERKPDQDILIKLAEFFDTTVDYLLGNSDIRNPYKEDSKIKQEYIEEIKALDEFRNIMINKGFDYENKTYEELAQIIVKHIKIQDMLNDNDNESN